MKKILVLLFVFHSFVGAVEHRSMSTVGTIYPQYKTALGSIVSGRVEEVLVDVGDPIKKGQELIRLDPTFFTIAVNEAEEAVASAKVELEDAQRNFERMKKLFEKPAGQTPSISQKRFEDAKTRFDQAVVNELRSEENLKRARNNLKEATIRAPYDGVVTRRLVHPGEPVNATPVTKLLEIISVDRLYVEFSLPQIELSRLQVGSPILLDIEGASHGKLTATIDLISPDIDDKSRSMKCRTYLDNRNSLFHPGSLVRVTVPMTKPLTAEEVPGAAL